MSHDNILSVKQRKDRYTKIGAAKSIPGSAARKELVYDCPWNGKRSVEKLSHVFKSVQISEFLKFTHLS